MDVFKHLDSLSKDEYDGLYPLYVDTTNGNFKGNYNTLIIIIIISHIIIIIIERKMGIDIKYQKFRERVQFRSAWR